MRFTRARPFGFTIIELMVVVAIIALLATIGTMTLTSRFATARVEEAARVISADIGYARSMAMLKGCRTRLTFCSDKNCTGPEEIQSTPSGSAGALVGFGASGVARAYAILRMSQVNSASPCWNNNAQAVGVDGYANWDFERKPQGIPRGVALTWNFRAPQNRTWDWDTTALTGTQATNSIFFNKDGTGNFPSGATFGGNSIVLQVQPDDCDPSNDDCFGIFITMSPGGVVSTMRCSQGARPASGNSDICY